MEFVVSQCDDGVRIGTGDEKDHGNGINGTLPEVLTIPSIIQGNHIIEIGSSALYSSRYNPPLLKCLFIEEGIQRLSYNSLREITHLKYLSIPSSLKELGSNALDDCFELETVHINQPSNLESIESKAFSTCSSLKELIIPNTLKTIGDYAFAQISVQFTLYFCGKQTIQTAKNIFTGTNDYQIIVPNNGAKIFGKYNVIKGLTPCMIRSLATCIIKARKNHQYFIFSFVVVQILEGTS